MSVELQPPKSSRTFYLNSFRTTLHSTLLPSRISLSHSSIYHFEQSIRYLDTIQAPGTENESRKEQEILPPGSEFPNSKAKERGNCVIYVLSAPSFLTLLRRPYIYTDHVFRKGTLVFSGETVAEVLLFLGECREEGKVIPGKVNIFTSGIKLSTLLLPSDISFDTEE
ncbi:hypothetical protein CEXT_553841 [Caerostris extrusa]|uniref:Uncharacterized protein n=1 Tax=Caerostris extrusa TaxID=172846 RepID=A0AAV4SCK5_CAEEX|nr:hypothetical protein CEXT_553841 [Caerostris extrusa]